MCLLRSKLFTLETSYIMKNIYEQAIKLTLKENDDKDI